MMPATSLRNTAPPLIGRDRRRKWRQWREVIATPAGLIDVYCAALQKQPPPRQALVVLPGKDRAAERYCIQWQHTADAHNLLIAVPAFDLKRFPGWRDYNLAGMLDRRGAARPRDRWLFPVLDEILTEIGRRFGITDIDLFGHSAGAQLLFRHAMFGGILPISSDIIIANAGWYTVPSLTVPFPYGLAGAPGDVDLRALFNCRLTLLAGGRDTDVDHHTLRQDAGAKRQGPHRLARALHCLESARATASTMAVPLRWRLKIVPGAAHSNAEMAPAALDLLRDQTFDGIP